jgi:hypothetical protein
MKLKKCFFFAGGSSTDRLGAFTSSACCLGINLNLENNYFDKTFKILIHNRGHFWSDHN